MRLCVTEIENGIILLMPKPDEFFIPLNEQDKNGESEQSTNSSHKHIETEAINYSRVESEKNNDQSVNSPKSEDQTNGDNTDSSNQEDRSPIENSLTTGVNENGQACEEDNSDAENDDFAENGEDVGDSFTQDHGLFSHKFSLTITVGGKQSGVQETEDNEAIIQGVQDQYRLIKSRFLPKVKKWLQVGKLRILEKRK